jgi:hypothetical protein
MSFVLLDQDIPLKVDIKPHSMEYFDESDRYTLFKGLFPGFMDFTFE